MRKINGQAVEEVDEVGEGLRCDHLSVLIQRIIRAWSRKAKPRDGSGRAGSRVIGGRCQNCQGDVQRIDDGVTLTNWTRLRQGYGVARETMA